jgi:beta-1,2-mannobiose phosphorylase / 1,2-beta-oligomannan phosphorylase
MWYSGGEKFEPNAIGYATSPDGLNWTKHPDNPIFRPDPSNPWEQERVTGCQVFRKTAGT